MYRPPRCRVCWWVAQMEEELDYLATPPPHDSWGVHNLATAFLSLRHGANNPERTDILTALERIFKRRARHADLADLLVVMHDHDRYRDMLFLDFLDWLPKRADVVRTGEARTPARGEPLYEELRSPVTGTSAMSRWRRYRAALQGAQPRDRQLYVAVRRHLRDNPGAGLGDAYRAVAERFRVSVSRVKSARSRVARAASE